MGVHKYKLASPWSCLSSCLQVLGWDSGELRVQALSLPQTVLQAGVQVFPSLAQAWSVLTLDVDGD